MRDEILFLALVIGVSVLALAGLIIWASHRHGLNFSEADHERLHRSADGGGVWPDVWSSEYSAPDAFRNTAAYVERIEADDPRLSSYQEWANGKKR